MRTHRHVERARGEEARHARVDGEGVGADGEERRGAGAARVVAHHRAVVGGDRGLFLFSCDVLRRICC